MAEKRGWRYHEKVKKPNVGENRKMALPAFSPETFLEYLVRFVMADDQVSPSPWQYLNILSSEVNPCCRMSWISRSLYVTMKELDQRGYPTSWQSLQSWGLSYWWVTTQIQQKICSYYLSWQESCGRVSLTADIWSNQWLHSFLAVTAHWIAQKNSKLELRAGLISFHRLKKRHTGKNIARTLYHLINRAGIKNKGSHSSIFSTPTYQVI